MAKEEKTLLEEEKMASAGGRVQFKETVETTLKRVAFAKTNLKIEPFYPSLEDSLVGFYDDPERDSREHVIRIVDREIKLGTKVYTVRGFSKAEV